MATYRRRKDEERSGRNTVPSSSFADIEDQHRQEASRQVQQASRTVDTSRADDNMDKVIERDNREAQRRAESMRRTSETADKRIDQVADAGRELIENVTRKEDKRGSLTGDVLVDEIVRGQGIQALEQAENADRTMDDFRRTADYTRMGGQQLFRGGVHEANRLLNEAGEGYMRWYESSPDNAYEQYAVRNRDNLNADLTDMNAGQGIAEQTRANYDFRRNAARDALRSKADTMTDEELYQLYMAQNPTGTDFDPEQMRQNIRDTADIATDEWFTDIYNANENELSDTEIGRLLENTGEQIVRGGLAAATGGLAGGMGASADAVTKAVSLGSMAYGIGGATTNELIEQGVDPNRAFAYGLAQAGVELGTENLDMFADMLGMGNLGGMLNNVVPGQAMGLREWGGEAIEEAIGQLVDPYTQMILNPDMTLWDAMKESVSGENLQAAALAGLEGAISAGMTSAVTHPMQTAAMVGEDIQNLQNLPGQLERASTMLSNKINNTNEYEKALNRELVNDPLVSEEQRAEKKREIRKEFLSEEQLRSEDSLVREAAQAANRDRILEQAREAGVDQKQAEITATLANRAGKVIDIRSRDSFVNEFGQQNGLYDPRTGEIVLSADTRDPFIKVATHEITHSLEGTEEYNRFMNFLFDAVQDGSLSTEYKSLSNLQDLIRESYADQMQTMTEAEQQELLNSETTAFLSQEMLGNEDVINALVQKDRNLAQRIYDGLKQFTARVTNNTEELNALDTQKTIRKALRLFDNAIESRMEFEREFDNRAKEVSKTMQKYFRDMSPEEMQEYLNHLASLDSDTIEKIAQNITGDNAVRFSITLNNEMAVKRDLVNEKQHNVDEDTMEKANSDMQSMADIMMKGIEQNPELLPGISFNKDGSITETKGKTLMKDASYGYSVENTTVCVRTLAYNELTNYVSEKVGRPLTAKESMLVSQMLYEIAVEPQCLYCYVSLDRKSYNEMILRYIKERNEAVRNYQEAGEPALKKYADPEEAKNNDTLFREFLAGRKPTKNMLERYYSWIDAFNRGEKFLTEKQVASDRLRSNIQTEGTQEQQRQLMDMLKYAQAASWAKKAEDYRAYTGDILKLSQRTVNKLNKHYGLRWYSFSDYTPAFILENMQQFADAAVKGLKGLAYTKDTDFARIFAPTGVNINISVFADVDKDGNFFIDPKISADIEDAIELRKQYPNVGIVVVAASNDAIEWSLNQEWSDVVIPFHIVRSGNDIADFYNWSIYNKDQNDTISEKQTWEEYLRSLGIDDPTSRKAKNVSRMIYPSEHQNDRATYMRLCSERGLTPRFAQFLGNENYMKLVNETRLSEQETPYLQPVFDMAEAEKSFKWFEDKGGYFEGWYKEGTDLAASAQKVADDINAISEGTMDMHDIEYGQKNLDMDDYLARSRDRKHMPRVHGRSIYDRFRADNPKYSRDLDYETAVEDGDMETAQEMVDESALEWGSFEDGNHKPLNLYHGTQSFGFTDFDMERMQDEMFLTSDLETASTYSGIDNRKTISDYQFRKDRDITDPYEIRDALEEHFNNDVYERDAFDDWEEEPERFEDGSRYRYLNAEETQRMVQEYNAEKAKLAAVLQEALQDERYANDAYLRHLLQLAQADRGSRVDERGREERLHNYLFNIVDGRYSNIGDRSGVDFDKLYEAGNIIGDRAFSYDGNIYDAEGFVYSLDEAKNLVKDRDEDQSKYGIYTMYGRMQNPLNIDGQGNYWSEITVPQDILNDVQSVLNASADTFTTRELSKYAKAKGYDGLVITDVQDNGGQNKNARRVNGDLYIFYNKQNVRSADPVTYDDEGNVIPLSQRFSDRDGFRYSRNLNLDSELKKLNPNLVSTNVQPSYTQKESYIRQSAIDKAVWDKAVEQNQFGKRNEFLKAFHKKQKKTSDFRYIAEALRQAQTAVDDDNRKALGAKAFGDGTYRYVLSTLRDEGISNAELLVDLYLNNIDYKGTADADAMLAEYENGNRVAQVVKLNIDPAYMKGLAEAHQRSIDKRKKTREAGMVEGTEQWWRKTLEKQKKEVKAELERLLPNTADSVDLDRMSPQRAARWYGTEVPHNPVGDAREFLRANGITNTAEYSNFLNRLVLDTVQGVEHDPSMLSRFRDAILSNENLAQSSEMKDGGFEWMVEQLEAQTRRMMDLDSHWMEYGSAEGFAQELTKLATVELTNNDHVSQMTRTVISGALGTTVNDPVTRTTVNAIENAARELSRQENFEFGEYRSQAALKNAADKVAEQTPMSSDEAERWIQSAYKEMQIDHGRNSRKDYVLAPSEQDIARATAERRAASAARTQEFFNERRSLYDTADYGLTDDVMSDEEFQQAYDEAFGDGYETGYEDYQSSDTSTFGAENYQFPTDKDAPEARVMPKKAQEEYEEATKGVDQGYVLKPEDYTAGKLESERTDDDRSQARRDAEQMREDIDTIMSRGQNKGSTAMQIEQNRDQISDGDEEVDGAMKRVIEDRFYEAKRRMFEHYKDNVRKLNYIVNTLGIRAGSEESKALQWLMEGTKDTNAENQSEVRYSEADLKQEFPDKWQDIVKAKDILEQMYDDYYIKINEALEMIYPEKALLDEAKAIREGLDNEIAKAQAYLEKLIRNNAPRAEIERCRSDIRKLAKRYNEVDREVRVNKRLPLRHNYVHHYFDVKPTLGNIYQAFKDVFNNEGNNNISNELADISEWTQPNARWWGAMQQRNSGEYTADAVGGMLRYMDRAEQKIFIDPYIAYMRGVVSEMKKSADEAGRDMSSMIRYYSTWVNDLAGKTNPYDRWLSYAFNGRGRQVVSLLKLINGRVKSNAVMGNLNSAIAQFYNLPNGIAIMRENGGIKAADDWRRGLANYMQEKFLPDQSVNESVFLTERFFDDFTSDLMDLSTPQKFTQAMMQFGDREVAYQIWYAAKAQAERLGKPNPVQYADEITRRAIAGRGIGEVAISQKAEIVKLIAPFQVEVNNQWQVMKHLVGERQAGALLGMFISAFLMNMIKRKVTNTEGTGLDPIQAILDAFKEGDGWFGKNSISANLMGNLTGEFISNMPFGAIITELAGLGSSGYTSLFPEGYDPTRYGVGNIGLAGLLKPAAQVISGNADKVDWTKLATNYLLPYGGRQAERTIKSLQDMGYLPHFGQGNYDFNGLIPDPQEGAYNSNGQLKYAINKDSAADVIRALLFGSYASEGGREYLDNNYSALGENATTVAQALSSDEHNLSEVIDTMRSLKDLEYPASTTNAKSLATRKALEDAGMWDDWYEAFSAIEGEDTDGSPKAAFRSGTNSIGKKVPEMTDEEFQRAYDEIFGEPIGSNGNVDTEEESVPAVTQTALSPSRQQAYDAMSNTDVDTEQLHQTMSNLEQNNVTDAEGNRIQNSRAAINRQSYEEDGSYQAIIDYIESDDNQNSDDPLTYADFGLSKTVVNMSDEDYDALLESINESTGSTYTRRRRRSGGSSRGSSRRTNVFGSTGRSVFDVGSGVSAVSSTRARSKARNTSANHRSNIAKLKKKTNSLTNGVMPSQDLYDQFFR